MAVKVIWLPLSHNTITILGLVNLYWSLDKFVRKLAISAKMFSEMMNEGKETWYWHHTTEFSSNDHNAKRERHSSLHIQTPAAILENNSLKTSTPLNIPSILFYLFCSHVVGQMHKLAYIHMCIDTHTNMYSIRQWDMHVYMHTHTHTYVYIHTHTHTHTHMYAERERKKRAVSTVSNHRFTHTDI